MYRMESRQRARRVAMAGASAAVARPASQGEDFGDKAIKPVSVARVRKVYSCYRARRDRATVARRPAFP
jgi:hypothetical protein